MGTILPNKPLIEAILDIKWNIESGEKGTAIDSSYPLSVGRLFDQVKSIYTYSEKLPASQVPDQLSPFIVKHRFRKIKDGWPLLQIGPGVASLNFTDSYTWDKFFAAVQDFIPKLINSISDQESNKPPKFTDLLLRYINGVHFDYRSENGLAFLREKLHVALQSPPIVVGGPASDMNPSQFEFNISIPSQQPSGFARLGIASGKISNIPGVIFTLSLTTDTENTPQTSADIERWLDQGHTLLERWFLAIVDGDLFQEFSREKD